MNISRKEKLNWISPETLLQDYGIKLALQAKLRSEKKIPYSKLGTKIIFYNRDKIDKWLESKDVEMLEEDK